MTKLNTVIARREGSSADQNKPIEVKMFGAGTPDAFISNAAMEEPFNPNTGDTQPASGETAAGEDNVTLSVSDMNDLVFFAECSNAECASCLYTDSEEAAKLEDGQTIFCVACGEETATFDNEEIAAKKKKVAEEEEEDDDMTVVDTEEDEEEGEEEEEEEDEDPTAEDAEDDEDEDDEYEYYEEDAAAKAAAEAEETPDDAATAGDEEDEEEEETADADDTTAEETPDDAATAGDEEDDDAATANTLTIDVTATMDFDIRSLRVSPVAPGTMSVFAAVDGVMQPLGSLQAAAASEANQVLFKDNKTEMLNKALVAALSSGGDYEEIGFTPITTTVATNEIFDSYVEEQTAAAKEAAAAELDNGHEDYKHSLRIALAGMNKGAYANPLLDGLAIELDRRGVKNTRRVAASILEAVGDDFVRAALDKAEELSRETPDARNAVAKLMLDAESTLAESEEDEESNTPTPATASSMPFSTAAIPSVMASGETASAPPQRSAARDHRRLFSGLRTGIRA